MCRRRQLQAWLSAAKNASRLSRRSLLPSCASQAVPHTTRASRSASSSSSSPPIPLQGRQSRVQQGAAQRSDRGVARRLLPVVRSTAASPRTWRQRAAAPPLPEALAAGCCPIPTAAGLDPLRLAGPAHAASTRHPTSTRLLLRMAVTSRKRSPAPSGCACSTTRARHARARNVGVLLFQAGHAPQLARAGAISASSDHHAAHGTLHSAQVAQGTLHCPTTL